MAEKVKDSSIEEKCFEVIKYLTEYREADGITTAKLAELTGIKQPNITRMETMKSKPGLESLVRIAEALGLNIRFEPKIGPKQ